MATHDFVIVIPVADRPLQLNRCLSSLQELLRRYPYAGALSVLLVDDSREPDNILRHRALAEQATRDGLTVQHLDPAAQRALIAALPADLQAGIAGIVGALRSDSFHHKGASITRNLAYLWLRQLPETGRRCLFWALDSDQEFQISQVTAEGETEAYAIDYLHDLDRIFSETTALIVTGKVVGDPPVSPAVMAGTLIDDLLAFFTRMAGLKPNADCTFHDHSAGPGQEAAYHDMADLFGFKPDGVAVHYRCPIRAPHDHAACLAGFVNRLKRFFDGEHPTRRSHYQAGPLMASLKPARTVYTGNYVFTAEALDWFVPFAALRLRMAGPTLGRIAQAALGERFVSANLPMLHRRTLEELDHSECRPGVTHAQAQTDLSDEFVRQYFGDVMLFSVERLTGQGYPEVMPTHEQLSATVEAVEAELRARYRDRMLRTDAQIERLVALINEPLGHALGEEEVPQPWWRAHPDFAETRSALAPFIADLRFNFGRDAPAWRLIETQAKARKSAIQTALAGYPEERATWQCALASLRR